MNIAGKEGRVAGHIELLLSLLLASCLSACSDPDVDPGSQELHWFQCVADKGLVDSPGSSRMQVARAPHGMERLTERPALGCFGVEMIVPAPLHSSRTRPWSSPTGGLRLEFPRHLLAQTDPPESMRRLDSFRVRIGPEQQATVFFDGDYTADGSMPWTRTESFLASLRALWHIEPTERTEQGFVIFETPTGLQRPNFSRRVYAPTPAAPDLLVDCALETLDNRGVRRQLPACHVTTTLAGLFEIRYTILGQDLPVVREIDARLKRQICGFIVPKRKELPMC
jgi:hypothetical protein